MKCHEVQQQLSAYHDGELPDGLRKALTEHISQCGECASLLDEFQSYTDTFKHISQPDVPPSVWSGISRDLENGTTRPEIDAPRVEDTSRRSWLTTAGLSLAASVLLLLGVGYWMSQHSGHDSGHETGHDAEFVMTMDHYLETLAADPDEAEKFLLNRYNGQTVEPEDAVRLVGYRPAVASGLPDNYTLASTSVMKMPCCTCVKAVCKRQDGSTLVLFEHDDEETEWFGDRPSNMATCGDKECCLVNLDESIAATWRRGSRWVTAVGVRDEAEVSELVTWLDSKVDAQPKTL